MEVKEHMRLLWQMEPELMPLLFGGNPSLLNFLLSLSLSLSPLSSLLKLFFLFFGN
jgi:hypothetical protein